ncbi:uncharacterized protein M6D78_013072 isoform 1-T2 [Vipera latastei]
MGPTAGRPCPSPCSTDAASLPGCPASSADCQLLPASLAGCQLLPASSADCRLLPGMPGGMAAHTGLPAGSATDQLAQEALDGAAAEQLVQEALERTACHRERPGGSAADRLGVGTLGEAAEHLELLAGMAASQKSPGTGVPGFAEGVLGPIQSGSHCYPACCHPLSILLAWTLHSYLGSVVNQTERLVLISLFFRGSDCQTFKRSENSHSSFFSYHSNGREDMLSYSLVKTIIFLWEPRSSSLNVW